MNKTDLISTSLPCMPSTHELSVWNKLGIGIILYFVIGVLLIVLTTLLNKEAKPGTAYYSQIRWMSFFIALGIVLWL